nr:helix-turn-helix transcriptional regulator [uncultured Dysosmobacter sp.]
MTLVEKVKALCEARELTFAALERRLDFGNGTIRKWDNATPSGDKLAKVADFFNVSVDYLLGRDSDETKSMTTDDPDENFTILSRNAKKLSPEKRKQLLDIAKVMFEEEFRD